MRREGRMKERKGTAHNNKKQQQPINCLIITHRQTHERMDGRTNPQLVVVVMACFDVVRSFIRSQERRRRRRRRRRGEGGNL
jgi:hypothetical protein